MAEKYEFDKENHVHKLDGKRLHGVTTVLSVISKPALIQWSANMAIEYVRNKSEEVTPDLFYVTAGTLTEAKTAHRKKRDKAGDWGTKVHEAVEVWVKTGKRIPLTDKIQNKVIDKFINWAEENNVEFLESEKNVWSKEMWIGGIVDLVFIMDGKKYIADIKTSSGIYNEAFFQMGAYHMCLEEMGAIEDVAGYIVINLKKDGVMDMKLADNMEINRQAFLNALGLHKIIKSLK